VDSVNQLPAHNLSVTREHLARAERVTPGGVHSNVRLTTRPHPLFFDRGEGTHLWDVDGNRYVDFILGQGAAFLGHGHPAVVGAVAAALPRGQLYGGQHRAEIELAELICELVPCAEQVRFNSSGSEAVQAALRIARAATGRIRIVKFEGHYHGWLDDVLVSVNPGRLPTSGSVAVAESAGQVVPTGDIVTVLPWNDADLVAAEVAGGEVAAVIMEPVAANHSVILPEPGYLEQVRAACARSGTVLIFDEIITGFRLGLGGAQQRFGVTPDLVLLGKAMANGFPIACVAGNAELFDGVGTGRIVHAGTFNANVSSVAAALATVGTLQRHPELYEAVARTGQRLLNGLAAEGGSTVVVQGLPGLAWIGFGSGVVKSARDLLGFDQERTVRLAGELARRSCHVTARGTWYVSPLHVEEDIDRGVKAFADGLAATPETGG
jgi:glutamate-1-semialdehyde 2,1-aminomutase